MLEKVPPRADHRGSMAVVAAGLALFLLAGAVQAAEPQILRNIHDVPSDDPGSEPRLMGRLDDGRLVFSASDVEHGREPWVSDGTAGGTARLADVCPGPCDSVQEAVSAGARVFFLAAPRDGSTRQELWATDGTAAGTYRVLAGLEETFHGSSLEADRTGRAFLSAIDQEGKAGLWVSDGTPAGTGRLPYDPVEPSFRAAFLGTAGDGVVYEARTGVEGAEEVWGTDGSDTGTRRLGADFGRTGGTATLGGGDLLVLQERRADRRIAVWRTDGTPAGTGRGPTLDGRLDGPEPVPDGDRALFVTEGDGFEKRLWASEGTAGGTSALLDLEGFVRSVTVSAGRVFLVVQSATQPCRDLRVIDGSGGGSLELMEVCEPSELVRPVPFRGGVALLVHEVADRTELWTSDGTAAGTQRVATPCEAGCNGRSIGGVFAPRGEEQVFFSVEPDFFADHGWDLYASDGSSAGTVRLAEGLPTAPRADSFTAVPGGVLFALDDGVHGSEPWLSDGTPDGTRLLVNAAPSAGDGDASPHGLVRRGDGFLFFARDAEGWGLWESDGTGPGTRRLHALFNRRPEESEDVGRPLALVDGRLYFRLHDGSIFGGRSLAVADLARGTLEELGPLDDGPTGAVHVNGRLVVNDDGDLVVSDGTADGTERSLEYRLRSLVAYDADTALFAGTRRRDGEPEVHGVWRTDGTFAGTVRIYTAERESTVPEELAATPGRVYFGVSNGDDGELWTSDATEAGTRRLTTIQGAGFGAPAPVPRRLTASGTHVFFTADRGSPALWISDGSEEGTEPRLTSANVGGQHLDIEVHEIVPFGDGVLVVVEEAAHGAELWKSSTRTTFTPRLADLWPGAEGSRPRSFAVGRGRAWFVANDGERRRLFATDGTGEGTAPVDGAEPPAEPVATPELLLLDDRVVYTAVSPVTGHELWTVPRAVAPPPGPGPGPPPAPRGLQARPSSSGTALVLVWQDLATDELYQQVEVKTPRDADFRALMRVPADREFANLTELEADLPHTFRVRAVNDAGTSPPSGEASAVPREPFTACPPNGDHLCLLAGRFYTEVFWRDPRSGDHGRGTGELLPRSDRSGSFWFFDEANVELVVKTLDGTPVNRRYWVFAGGLTDVEYWLHVTDTGDGSQRVYYQGSRDLCGLADIGAFAGGEGERKRKRTAAASPGGADALELVGGRFRVEVEWTDQRSGDTGVGHAVPGTDSTGYFWFFDEVNTELVVKVLDGRPVNGRWWVFHGGLTDVEYRLRVTDTVGNVVRTYRRPPGSLCGGADTTAF